MTHDTTRRAYLKTSSLKTKKEKKDKGPFVDKKIRFKISWVGHFLGQLLEFTHILNCNDKVVTDPVKLTYLPPIKYETELQKLLLEFKTLTSGTQ